MPNMEAETIDTIRQAVPDAESQVEGIRGMIRRIGSRDGRDRRDDFDRIQPDPAS